MKVGSFQDRLKTLVFDVQTSDGSPQQIQELLLRLAQLVQAMENRL